MKLPGKMGKIECFDARDLRFTTFSSWVLHQIFAVGSRWVLVALFSEVAEAAEAAAFPGQEARCHCYPDRMGRN